MSKPRVYSDNSLRVMERFFQAFEICQKMKLIGSVTEFCKVQGIDKAHFYTQRMDRAPHRGMQYLSPLDHDGQGRDLQEHEKGWGARIEPLSFS